MDRRNTLGLHLGAAVSKARRKAGVSQVMLAEAANISRDWLSKIERGRANTTLVIFCDVAYALSHSPVRLLYEAESRIMPGLKEPHCRSSIADTTSPDLLDRLGSVIAKRRRELGFTQQEVSDVAGLWRTYLAEVEGTSRVHNVTIETLYAIARALNTSGSWLLARALE